METEDTIGREDGSADVRRPMNAFLIFCKRHRSVVRDKYDHLDNRSITRILGDLWAKLDPKEKRCYTELAKEYKEHFMKAHPDYKWYNPDKSGPLIGTRSMTRPTNSRPGLKQQIPEDGNAPVEPVHADDIQKEVASHNLDPNAPRDQRDGADQNTSSCITDNESSHAIESANQLANTEDIYQTAAMVTNEIARQAAPVGEVNIVDHVIDAIYSKTNTMRPSISERVISSTERIGKMQLMTPPADSMGAEKNSLEDVVHDKLLEDRERSDYFPTDRGSTESLSRSRTSTESLARSSPDLIRERLNLPKRDSLSSERSDEDQSSMDSFQDEQFNKFRKRAFSDASKHSQQGKKTVEFDLEAEIAHLPPCHQIGDLAKRRNTFKCHSNRRRHHSDHVTKASDSRRRHHSEGSKRHTPTRGLVPVQPLRSPQSSVFKLPPENWVSLSGRGSAELKSRVSPSPPLVTGSQKRKARRQPITHMVPVSRPNAALTDPLDLKHIIPSAEMTFRPLSGDLMDER